MNFTRLTRFIVLSLLLALVAVPSAHLQAQDMDMGDEDSFAQPAPYGDDGDWSTGPDSDYSAEEAQQGGVPGSRMSKSQTEGTEGGQYSDDTSPSSEALPPGVKSPQERQMQLQLAGERDMLPMNIAWGAATGGLIGSWFAITQGGNQRATLRAVGLGLVLGAALGLTVGMRSVINPNSVRAAEEAPIPPPVAWIGENPAVVLFNYTLLF